MLRIKKNDVVKITTGGNKGKIGKVTQVDAKNAKVWVEGVNIKERHIRPSRVNPRGGKKDVHLALDISNVKLVHDGKEAVTKVAYKVTDSGKIRVAKATGKEIK